MVSGTLPELEMYEKKQYFDNLNYLHETYSGGIGGAIGHYYWGETGRNFGGIFDAGGMAKVSKGINSIRPR